MNNIPEDYCRQKAAAAGTNFYYSTLYSPVNIKHNLYALHAYAIELDELITECTDPGVARMKLGWWAEETQRLIDGQPRHPVTRLLVNVKEHFPEIEPALLQLIRYYEQHLNIEPPDNYQGLMDFLMEGPGLLWKLSARICNPHDTHTPDIIALLGCQFGWFQIIQNTHDNMQKNRNYWPRDEISGSPDELYAFQIKRLLEELENGTKLIADIDRFTQLPALIMTEIISRTCEEIKRSGYRIDRERITLTPFRKLLIAWKTRRKNRPLH